MAVDFLKLISSPDAAYGEGLRFFRGTGMLNEAIKKLAKDLEREDIDYVAIGAIALNRHGYRRFTEDIDLLLTVEGLERFRERLVGLGYRPAFQGARNKFRSSENNIPIEVITTGEYPGDGLPKSVVFPVPHDVAVDIEGVQTISLDKLIELKLASGISAPHRLKDLADVQELVKIKHLDASYAENLDESVRAKFIELADAVQAAGDEPN